LVFGSAQSSFPFPSSLVDSLGAGIVVARAGAASLVGSYESLPATLPRELPLELQAAFVGDADTETGGVAGLREPVRLLFCRSFSASINSFESSRLPAFNNIHIVCGSPVQEPFLCYLDLHFVYLCDGKSSSMAGCAAGLVSGEMFCFC
jgi:hypothetical protein